MISTLALAYAGLVALCLGMERHHVQVLRTRPSVARTRALRGLGWGVLAASYAASVAVAGPGIGTVEWIGAITAGAGALVVLLPYAARVVTWSAAVAFAGGA